MERAGHRAAMSLNALHLRLSDLRGKALAMSEEKESLSERKGIEEDTTPVFEPASVSYRSSQMRALVFIRLCRR